MTQAPEIYRIGLDREWDLDDLYQFPHTYSQAYAFLYCINTDHPVRDRERLNASLYTYPWKGGFSYVNAYTMMNSQLPPVARPWIHALSKSSPGWMDLVLYLDVAAQIAQAVSAAVLSGAALIEACNRLQRALREFRRARREFKMQDESASMIEVMADAETYALIIALTDEIAGLLGTRNAGQLQPLTNSTEVSAQLLLVHYRRIVVLSEFVMAGKIQLPIAAAK